METKKIKQVITSCIIIILCNTSFGQHWRLGGNSNLPAVDDITVPGNNFLGSNPVSADLQSVLINLLYTISPN